jgi:hypothetical protein
MLWLQISAGDLAESHASEILLTNNMVFVCTNPAQLSQLVDRAGARRFLRRCDLLCAAPRAVRYMERHWHILRG